MFANVQSPDLGSPLLSTLPASSTATHSDASGQETPVMARPPSIGSGDHAAVPGSRFTNAYPRPSTATQRPFAAHETAFRDWPGSIAAVLHDGAAAVGSRVLRASPCWSTATHSDSDAHETAVGTLPESNAAGADHPSEAAACAGSGAAARQRRAINADSRALAARLMVGGWMFSMDCKPGNGIGVAVRRRRLRATLRSPRPIAGPMSVFHRTARDTIPDGIPFTTVIRAALSARSDT